MSLLHEGGRKLNIIVKNDSRRIVFINPFVELMSNFHKYQASIKLNQNIYNFTYIDSSFKLLESLLLNNEDINIVIKAKVLEVYRG